MSLSRRISLFVSKFLRNRKKCEGFYNTLPDLKDFVGEEHQQRRKKIYTAEGSSIAKTTTYINQFVYEGDNLQYINFEEGRKRLMTPVSTNNGFDGLAIDGNMDLPNGKKGSYDYFVRDYQENVRMILTEESHYSIGQCTMETVRAGNEEPVFGQVEANGQISVNNEVAQTRFAVSSIPGQITGGGWQNTAIGSQVSRLGSLSGKKTGPNSLLKVMAGDVISANVQYYYKNAVTNGTGNNLTTNVVNALIQAITGSSSTSGLAKGATTAISSNLSVDPLLIAKTAPDVANASGSTPKAYLTVLFFDERFKFVEESSSTLRVSQVDAANASLTLANIKAPKNGYVYIYVSNESSEYVYFDNLQVADTRGRIIEEDHYYPFGLKIAGISSKKLGDFNEGLLDNKNLYNDKELIDEADLNWFDYGFRNYDAQIGRFPQLDPLTNDYPYYTPYQYAGNEPIANVDIDGLEPGSVIIGGVSHGIVGPGSTLVNLGSKAASIASMGANAAKVALTAISLRGTSDAIKNASSLGIYDYWGGNHLNEYKTPAEQQAYLQGKLNGDALIIAMGTTQMNVGGGVALSTGIQTLGVGAAVGGAVALHGAISAGLATADIAKTLKLLYELSGDVSGANDAGKNSSCGGNEKVGTNSRKMSEKEIGDFFGDKNWHQSKAKTKFIQKYIKQLKGSTNADFHMDKTTNEVLLQGNKSKEWVKTGQFFKE